MYYYIVTETKQAGRNIMNTFTKAAMKVQQSIILESIAKEEKLTKSKDDEFFIKENNKRDQMIRNGLEYTG